MNTFVCMKCGYTKEKYDQEVFDFQGILDFSDMDIIAVESEKIALDEVDYIYYYFKESSLDKVKNSGNAGALPRQYCVECTYETIRDTYITKDPHYGDGVYLSVHDNLIQANQKVKCAQGEEVSNRVFRAKFRILDSKCFKKVLKTGGAIRTIENVQHTELFLLINDERTPVDYLGVERYQDGKWSAYY